MWPRIHSPECGMILAPLLTLRYLRGDLEKGKLFGDSPSLALRACVGNTSPKRKRGKPLQYHLVSGPALNSDTHAIPPSHMPTR